MWATASLARAGSDCRANDTIRRRFGCRFHLTHKQILPSAARKDKMDLEFDEILSDIIRYPGSLVYHSPLKVGTKLRFVLTSAPVSKTNSTELPLVVHSLQPKRGLVRFAFLEVLHAKFTKLIRTELCSSPHATSSFSSQVAPVAPLF